MGLPQTLPPFPDINILFRYNHKQSWETSKSFEVCTLSRGLKVVRYDHQTCCQGLMFLINFLSSLWSGLFPYWTGSTFEGRSTIVAHLLFIIRKCILLIGTLIIELLNIRIAELSGWRNIDFEIALDYFSEITGLGHRESETLFNGPAINAGRLHEGFASVSWSQDSFLDIGCVFVHEFDVIFIWGYYRF